MPGCGVRVALRQAEEAACGGSGWRLRLLQQGGRVVRREGLASVITSETSNDSGGYRMREDYVAFLTAKGQQNTDSGFEPTWLPDFLFDFQRALVEWAVRKGRGGIFADCGLGKTPMELVWAENTVRHTNRPVLILAPLAVAQQTVREAQKFG